MNHTHRCISLYIRLCMNLYILRCNLSMKILHSLHHFLHLPGYIQNWCQHMCWSNCRYIMSYSYQNGSVENCWG